MMTSDHDQLLDRILPHVDRGAITAAKNTIKDLDWDDESDSADFEEPFSVTTRSVLTRTNSETSYGVFSGGLSPSRPPRQKDFDGFTMDNMADPRDTNDGHGQTNGNAAVRYRGDADLADLPRSKSGSRAGHVASGKSSPRHTREGSDTFGSVDVPLRHSSRPVSGSVGVPSLVDKPLPELKEPRPQHPVIAEDVEQTAHDGVENGDDQAHRGSNQRRARSPLPPPAPSATPPPIAHKPTQNGRRIVYDDFPDEDEDDTDDDHGVGDPEDGVDDDEDDYDERLAQQVRPTRAHEARGGPPLAQNNTKPRKRERRADSIASNNSRGSRTARSRTANLARDYKGLRTPILDHLQMYQDAESKRPLVDRTIPPVPQRPVHQKTYRSVDDGMYNDYAARSNGIIGSSAHEGVSGGPIRRRYSDDDISVRSVRNSISGRTAKSTGSQSMPDFFSSEIFQVVLHNPTTAYQLLKFSESRLCSENVEFLSKVDEYRTTLNNLAGQMAFIHKQFISPGSAFQINVNGGLLKRAHKEMKTIISSAFPSMETVFTELQDQIETLVFQDVYPRFVRHQMALSATRALATDRFKYQGLGDCFCLTNPRIADNPIVFASDGFIKTTGYSRSEVVPRNCRFLQGAHTDRQPVQRLKTAIGEEKESVELLLNYKKNGDPFWNLLYVAPLYNQRGKIEFFIGGQVNCSTTIHSNVDVLKVLSTSAASEAEAAEVNKPLPPVNGQHNKTSARKTILKALGMRQNGNHAHVPQMDAGMENGVLGRMEGQDLNSQMKEFYTAYSKYLVVRANNFVIEFYSEGIVDMLNPANMSGTMVAGTDVFRFFSVNMMVKQSEYKVRVRNAIRAGMPVSTELRLQTRRSAIFRGDEKFVAHWTPLKDEKAAVQWVIITLAPLMA